MGALAVATFGMLLVGILGRAGGGGSSLRRVRFDGSQDFCNGLHSRRASMVSQTLFMKYSSLLHSVAVSSVLLASAFAADPIFKQDFQSLELGPAPKEFLPLAGSFAVVVDGANKVLELPGEPLDTFGALFGPSHAEDSTVSARFFGTKKGRKFPTFALSLRGAGGYRLQVSPGKGQLEVYKGDEPVSGVAYAWQTEKWTWLKLSVAKAGDGWEVLGWAWLDGDAATKEPLIRVKVEGNVSGGRAGIWGSPYSGTAIRFDDLLWEGGAK